MNKDEVKRELANIVAGVTMLDFENPITPQEAYKKISNIIDNIFAEQFKYNWHTEPPKEDGTYLVQLKALTGARILNTVCLNCGCWVLSQDLIDDGLIIEAWTESPEFYKEETNDRKTN